MKGGDIILNVGGCVEVLRQQTETCWCGEKEAARDRVREHIQGRVLTRVCVWGKREREREREVSRDGSIQSARLSAAAPFLQRVCVVFVP